MTVVPGFSGHLVTPSFLARHPVTTDASLNAQWRAVAAVNTAARSQLGPASSVRLIFDLAAAPFVNAIGLA